MKNMLLFLAILFLTGSQIKGGETIIPRKTTTPPVIDGTIESLWGKPSIPDFITVLPTAEAGRIPENRTRGYLLYDESFLYLAFECDEHNMQGLVTDRMKGRDGSWGDDGLEIFLDPGRSGYAYYQIMINADGIVSDWEWRSIDTGVPSETKNWDSNVLVKTAKGNNGWTCELRIPWAEFAGNYDVTGPWGMNVARWEPRKSLGQSWAPLIGGFHQPARFQELKFGLDLQDYSYRISNFSFGALSFGNNRLICKVKNEGKEKSVVEAKIAWQISEGALRSTTNQYDLSPGETKEVSLNYKLEEKGRPGKAIFSLLNPKNGFIHLQKVRYFTIPSALLNLKMDQVYYLSDSKADLKVTINLGDADREKSHLAITVFSGGAQIFCKEIYSPTPQLTIPIAISKLGPGEYKTSVEFMDFQKHLLESKNIVFKRVENPF